MRNWRGYRVALALTITAWVGTAASCNLNSSNGIGPGVLPNAPVVAIRADTIALDVSEAVRLTFALLDATGGEHPDRAATFTVSDSTIAHVSADGVVTARAYGTTTVTITCETASQRAAVIVSRQPHEPAGFTPVTERAFDAVARSPADVVAAEGWDPNEESQWTHISIVPDATAPRSPPNVLQAWYPAGTTGGTSNATPGRMERKFAASQSVYVDLWVKLSSNWRGNGTLTNKVFYIWLDGQPNFFMSAEGAGTGALVATGRLQGTMDSRDALPPNLSSALVQRGQWQHWEILIRANTPGRANGQFHLWVNGTKVSQYTNVGYLQLGETQPFMMMDLEPIWGGAGSTLGADQYMYFDHVYVSVR